MYDVVLAPAAVRGLDRLPERVRSVATDRLHAIADNPYRLGKRLTGPWAGYRSSTFGGVRQTWRILYRVDHEAKRVLVVRLGPRSHVYAQPPSEPGG